MNDLEKLLKGKPIYRHEDLKQVADKWEGWATFLQFSSIGGLFAMMFILDALPKETARVVVWYLAGFLFIYATVAFFVARHALKYRMAYLNAEGDRVSGLFDQAITKVKEK